MVFYHQKNFSGKRSVIVWYTFFHLVVNAMSEVVHFKGCKQLRYTPAKPQFPYKIIPCPHIDIFTFCYTLILPK